MTEQTKALFASLEDVLRSAGCTAPDLQALRRALWANVHGAVFLAGQGSLSPVTRDEATTLFYPLLKTSSQGIAR